MDKIHKKEKHQKSILMSKPRTSSWHDLTKKKHWVIPPDFRFPAFTDLTKFSRDS